MKLLPKKILILLAVIGVIIFSAPLTKTLAQDEGDPPQCASCDDAINAAVEAAEIAIAALLDATELFEWTNPVPPVGNLAGTWPRLQRHLQTERNVMMGWMMGIWWEDNIAPAMMLMTNELTAVSMKQAEIVGAFLDAKTQIETQQVLRTIAARSHKDYQPSIGMCQFGSTAKSLAASERKGELNAIVLSQRSQDRNLGNINTSAAGGKDPDTKSRLKQFREKYCDPRDNNGGLAIMCSHSQDTEKPGTLGAKPPGGIGAEVITTMPPTPVGIVPKLPPDERKNRDIDYARAVDAPWTLDMDFTDEKLTNHEEDVMALANNLYSHELFRRPPAGDLKGDEGSKTQRAYLDMRSVLAKRSVAENSFNAITSMKSSGVPGSRDYLSAILEQFLIPVAPGAPASPAPNDPRAKAVKDFEMMLGQNPSYYAQMEILTKKLFQNPDFYTNLYDTPANVTRKGVAIQAISLMQKFDLYKSYLRNEASLSVLLELAVDGLQKQIDDTISPAEAAPGD